MLFDSVSFAVFFGVVVLLHHLMPNQYRNLLLLGASYFFYGWWSVPYLGLIAGLTAVDYVVARRMEEAKDGRRRAWLAVSLAANLGMLLFFKFPVFRHGVVPLGVSFHTLQGFGYAVDVYRRDVAAERNLTKFALFVAFFPQLIAGPIERAGRMLPQFDGERRRIAGGGWLILRGLLKKTVVADLAAPVVNQIYGRPHDYPPGMLLLATVLFAAQIYCDFSGYSDMAVGLARMLGYDLTINFREPWRAQSLGEFWRRWHVSLSQWFRDYVYIPAGGNRKGAGRDALNILIVFLASGLWHGGNWTWLAWGGLHGVMLLAGKATARVRDRIPDFRGRAVLAMVMTNALVILAWVPFRAATLADAGWIYRQIFSFAGGANLSMLWATPLARFEMVVLLFAVAMVPVLEATRGRYLRTPALRLAGAAAGVYSVVFFGVFKHLPFIYFQF